MRTCMIFFQMMCLCVSTLFLSGMEGCSQEDDAEVVEPAAFVSAAPPDGSTIQEDFTILATFDGPPEGLTVEAFGDVTFSVAGSVVTITGGFPPGGEKIVLTWDGGTKVLTYTVPEPEVEFPKTDRYVGENIIYSQGGSVYEGRVVKGVSEDEILVRLTNGSEEVIRVARVGGTLIPDHADIGTEVVMLGDRDKDEDIFLGEIAAVYDSDVRKIRIHSVFTVQNKKKKLDVPRIHFVHEDTDIEDGGYITSEEFGRIIGGG